ncbi:MAG: DUF805 domain-containing protein [Proteobacteria bacterium]|nr:DUF805 domain-containing protein [Pseudomonadota bacterium]
MGFRSAVTVCIQDYYTFSGRARRSEYWWFILFVVAGNALLSLIDAVIFGDDMLLGLSGLFALLTFLPQIAVLWRRLHDTGRPGWLNFLPSIPLVALFSGIVRSGGGIDSAVVLVLLCLSILLMIAILVFLALPSQPGENRFGPEPPP